LTEFDSHDLPAFRVWREEFQPPPDGNAYLAEHLSVTAATLFAELMSPDLVLVQGCVILGARYTPDNFEQWWSSEEGNVASIERALNHLHLWDIFEPAGAVEERAVEALAVRIARSWKLHAERQFPDRKFVAEVTDEYGPTVVMSSQPRAQP